MQILLHSSKTMRQSGSDQHTPLGSPLFLKEAARLHRMLASSSQEALMRSMKISSKKAQEVERQLSDWSTNPSRQTPAIDAFLGDIYSGLQVQAWSEDDRRYAHEHLFILSGLYGGLRACDGIMPYRFEMGYRLPDERSAYQFWSDKIASLIRDETIINLSAVEYTKALLPYLDNRVITPKFLTISPKTDEPTFVTVHAKIARGAFAGWMIRRQVDNQMNLRDFTELGYRYDEKNSTEDQPVFVCGKFQGIGLSVRLSD